MPYFKVLGTIVPAWFEITFDVTPEIAYRIEEIAVDLRCSVNIEKSVITANCETNRFDERVLSWVLPYVFDWISAEVDLFSFSTGRALLVNIDRVEWPGGTIGYLAGTAPDLAELATAFNVTDSDGKIHVVLRDAIIKSISEPALMLALRDLGASLRYGNNSLINY